MSALTIDFLIESILADAWQTGFSEGSIFEGARLASGKRVREVRARLLETGDAEIEASVIESSGEVFRPVIAVWFDGDRVVWESDCSCPEKVNCRHAAAVLCYLKKGKGDRVIRAFGGAPEAEKMMSGKVIDPTPKSPSDSLGGSVSTGGGKRGDQAPSEASERFLLRVENRPEGERAAWLPEVVVSAYAIYEGQRVPLDPSGQLSPIVLADQKIHRDRSAETKALNCLYALGLRPGAEEPPVSLKKLDRPEVDGTLWAPDREEWPHPDFYWQRFRHEGAPALEKRGWDVRYAPGVGHEPLVFRAETWSAEIVEEGKGWFHLSAGFEIDGEAFELQPILAALLRNRFLELTEGLPAGQEFLIFLPDGRGLALPVGRFRNLLQTLGELTDFKFGEGSIRLSKVDAATLVSGAVSEAVAAEAPVEIEELGERLIEFERIDRVSLPSGLKATLRDYQLEGYYWMQFLARSELNGILADDMGLGKTLQSLAHLLAEIEAGVNEELPSLVVAPTSVVFNWEREAKKFAPGLRVLVLQGGGRKALFRSIPEADLVLTSYALLHRDIEVLEATSFHLLLLDEAQHIKNSEAQVAKAARRLLAKHRLCLSGTPIENNLGELWSLMRFLMPGMLGSREEFRTVYQTPIEKNESEEKRRSLAARVGPLILRRTKLDVAKELPPKTEIVHAIEMTEAQKDLYETVRATMDKHVRQALAIRGQEAQIVFLEALLKLRQICCHPRLLKEEVSSISQGAESAKFDYLLGLLDTLRAEGHRTLVFSQFTSMIALIEEHLVSESISYLKLTGATKDRQELVERFQGGEGEVFLISLKAGGTGLTLTGADTVIHYDPWWNPAAENQATDRAYRIGQDKPVFVHKLICGNTVEEKIQQMQERKDDLAGGLLSGAMTSLNLTPETMGELLGTGKP